MEKYYFDPVSLGFYLESVHGADMVSGLVAVSVARHAELMDEQASGRVLSVGVDGLPVTVEKVKTLEESRREKLDQLRAHTLEVEAGLMSEYTAGEVATWQDQEREARAFVELGHMPVMLSALAEVRGLEVGELVSRVLVNAENYRTFAGGLYGWRQKVFDAIMSADSVGALDEIEVIFGD